MCGFVGFIGKQDNKDAIITDMMNTIIHRGPDGSGKYVDDDIALGHRRLSIIDVSESGNQPIFNKDHSKVLVYNGEIYNYKDIRSELMQMGCSFRTETDSEVILLGYEVWGEEIVKKLRGMFAFVIWDSKSRELFGARDWFGIKPFYYTQQNNSLMFASEIKAFLVHPDFNKTFNEDVLSLYLSFQFVPTNETFFKNVFCLEPGHYFKAGPNLIMHKTRYFDPLPSKETCSLFGDELAYKVEEVMKDSVQAHMVSDVEVASYLSSGIDSSYLAYLSRVDKTYTVGFTDDTSVVHSNKSNTHNGIVSKMPSEEESCPNTYHDDTSKENGTSKDAHIYSDNALSNDDMRPADDKYKYDKYKYNKYSEIAAAKEFAASINMKNDSELIDPDEYWGKLSDIMYYMDEPVADPAAIALYFLSRTAAKDVKVVLSGEGSDELFGGYNIYCEPLEHTGFNHIPAPIRKSMGSFAEKSLPKGFKGRGFLIRHSKTLEERYFANATNIFTEGEAEKLLKIKNKTSITDLTAPLYDKVSDRDDVTKMQYIDMHLWLVHDILMKGDKMGMANSVEVRVPFLDKKVFDFTSTLKLDQKVMPPRTKVALRSAAEKAIQKKTAEKKKLGFPVPTRVWLREAKYYNIVKEKFLSESSQKFFDTDMLMSLLDAHKNGEIKNEKTDNSRKIWAVYIFLVWYDRFFSSSANILDI